MATNKSPPPPPVAVAPVGAASAAAASPSTPSPAPSPSVECCMCGDHGLARELFRCRSCHFRYQHKYCSDLYPKAETYRACNWCLREDGTTAASGAAATAKSSAKHSNHHSPSSSSKDHHHHHHPHHHQPASTATADQTNHKTAATNNNSHSLSSSTSTADNNSTGSSGAVKQLQRGGDYAAHLLAKPLKKLRPALLERSASEVIVRVKAAEEMGAAPQPARRVAAGGVRGKIRRYKLLEEVSS